MLRWRSVVGILRILNEWDTELDSWSVLVGAITNVAKNNISLSLVVCEYIIASFLKAKWEVGIIGIHIVHESSQGQVHVKMGSRDVDSLHHDGETKKACRAVDSDFNLSACSGKSYLLFFLGMNDKNWQLSKRSKHFLLWPEITNQIVFRRNCRNSSRSLASPQPHPIPACRNYAWRLFSFSTVYTVLLRIWTIFLLLISSASQDYSVASTF